MHPVRLRCSSAAYAQYPPSSRRVPGVGAPRRSRCYEGFPHGLLAERVEDGHDLTKRPSRESSLTTRRSPADRTVVTLSTFNATDDTTRQRARSGTGPSGVRRIGPSCRTPDGGSRGSRRDAGVQRADVRCPSTFVGAQQQPRTPRAAVHRTRADRRAGVNGLGGQRSPTGLEETTAADSRAAARCSGVSRSTVPRRSISWARSPGGVPADATAAGRLSVSSVFVFGMVAMLPG